MNNSSKAPVSNTNKASKPPKYVLSIMLALGIWLICLLALASWYQANYIQNFTERSPKFLDSQYTEGWIKDLSALLPVKTSTTRVIQFWKPNCLCNRFAQRHALNAIKVSSTLNIEHITVIPNANKAAMAELQQLNPDTKIITLKSSSLEHWPASPSVVVEGPFNQPLYFGPLGFGAFCSQSSSDVIEQQLRSRNIESLNPFFNVIGKGCFCAWSD